MNDLIRVFNLWFNQWGYYFMIFYNFIVCVLEQFSYCDLL